MEKNETEKNQTHFGFQTVPVAEKAAKVEQVFDSVAAEEGGKGEA